MRLSVERLRWGLLAGALLLVGVVVVMLGYGRYRAVQAWRQIVARSGATITHETDGITWSQAVRGKTVFVLHAKHAVPHGEGRYTLQDGSLVLYDAKGQPADRISGAQFEYDEQQGLAHAVGEVDMEVQPPVGITASSKGKAGAERQAIHVRTSGLTYVKKLGVAATDQEVEIEYGGMHGWAKGAEFDSGQSVVHLLGDVRAEAELRGTPVTLNATKADLDQDAEVIDLTAPRMESRGRTATAATAVLHLRKDGSLETAEGRGGVTLKEGTRTISAPSMNAVMNQDSQPQHAELSGGVALVDTSTVRPMKGSARTVRIACDSKGNPTGVVAEGGATLSSSEPRPGAQPLARQFGADRMTLTLVKARHETRVSAVHSEGNAWASGDAVVRGANGKPDGVKASRIAADDLKVALVRNAAGRDEPQSMSGAGHARIEQHLPDGTVQTSIGESLQAEFKPASSGAGVEIASAEQAGHVQMHSTPGKPGEEPSEGTAERAAMDGPSDVVTLSGHPRVSRGDTSVSAGTIKLTQSTGDAVAEGSVAATLVNAKAKADAPVTHVLAQRATLRRAEQTAEFVGTDAAPARMWQGASQVEAANLLLDRAHDAMHAWPASATGLVRSVFANEGEAVGKTTTASPQRKKGDVQIGSKNDRVVRVTSERLDYFGVSREAIFRDNVLAQAEDGEVRGQYGVAFLSPKPGVAAGGQKASGANSQPDPVASSLDRIVMSKGVKVQQPGRVGTGEQLLYTAATGEFVLTGTPGHSPHVVDDKQGSITGETLLFRSPDSTIVVAGTSPGMPGSHRVHTETTIKK